MACPWSPFIVAEIWRHNHVVAEGKTKAEISSLVQFTLMMTEIVVKIYEFQLCGVNCIGSG